MSISEVSFTDKSKGIEAYIDFSYTHQQHNAEKWIDIISLKKNDKESCFVFQVNYTKKIFQVFFGNGSSIIGKIQIDMGKFQNKRSVLTYTRNSNFTFVSLSCDDSKESHFSFHENKISSSVDTKYYHEGSPNEGITIHSKKFQNIPLENISLSFIEKEFFNHQNPCKNDNYYRSAASIGSFYFSQQSYAKAFTVFKQIYSASSSNLHIVPIFKVRTCINKLNNETSRSQAWMEFTSPADILFGNSCKALQAGDIKKSLRLFEDGVEQTFSTKPYNYNDLDKKKILDAYQVMLNGFYGNITSKSPEIKHVKKIIVSGMVWSGSGAIYDYLKEFDSVIAIKGETPYIEGPASLEMIYPALSDNKSLKNRIINFFFYTLIGHQHLRDTRDYRNFQHARQRLAATNHDRYLDSIQGWCAIASTLYSTTDQQKMEIFLQLADFTVNNFSIDQDIPENKIALLDNVVHISSTKCISFLNNTSILCSFRDPRSNYVALLREAKNFFHGDISSYIRDRKKAFNANYKCVKEALESVVNEKDKSIEVINFESFILSEKFREKLAFQLGLDLRTQKKHTFFKPWESMRNVILHQEHHNQEEIKLIEKELGEYCYEPYIHPLLDKPQNNGE